ncbi:MAG: hypothetical protein AAF657_09560 [Acidobacteriota bacterium]
MNDLKPGIVAALVSALVLAVVSTFGDWLWTHYIPDGAVIPGVLHGAVIFLVLAGTLAWSAGTRQAARRLLPSLPAAGIVIAAVFYPLAYAVGYIGALIITWMVMWLAMACLQRWARDGAESLGHALLRGVLAAIASGLAFWAISGIWTKPAPGGPNYLVHFASWAFAFLPGFLALLVRQPVVKQPES